MLVLKHYIQRYKMENIELINKLNYSGELEFEEFKHLLSTYDQKDF